MTVQTFYPSPSFMVDFSFGHGIIAVCLRKAKASKLSLQTELAGFLSIWAA
jgi:hypothetical protein